ncbi:PKD domain-containing protein [Algoriphagus sp. Y33]|uniref:PKD domain-containing protein n=1 Tax=Algoriphagus sp. Y33 TaxID=2772483 RepID=UPI0017838615|nr:PKD domain-containing protein [Algoriphagus sp. Y33]
MKKIYTVLILYVALVQNISAQSEAETESQGLEQLRMEMEQRVQEEIQTRFVSSFSFNDSDMENSQGDEMSTPSNRASQYSIMSSPAVSLAEFNALKAIYNSSGGSGWTNKTGWTTAGSPPDVSGWYGITVDGAGHVVELNLQNNNLVGTLPTAISGLTYLNSLNVDGNHLTGAIPATLGSMTGLSQLLLSNNEFSGAIPTQLGSITNLVYLNISYNPLLVSTIPAQLGNLSQLQVLLLTYSNLTGGIPTSFGNLTSLHTLYLTGNNLTGPIISQINQMSSLSYLQLGANKLSGAIPATLLSLPHLEGLFLYDNQFSGSLPGGTANFTGLKSFVAYGSGLSGTIPAWLGEQKMLNTFNIGYNGFSGELPPGLMGEGPYKLEFRTNNNPGLKGKLPEKVSAVTGLVDISYCNFSFNDFLSVYSSFSGSQFTYSPQGLVDVQKNSTERIGFTFKFIAEVDREIRWPYSNATYKWYKLVNGTGVPMEAETSRSGYRYTTPYLTDPEYGTYYYTITHSNAPLLTLRSRNHVLTKNTASLGTVAFDAYNVYCAAAFEPDLNLIEGCTPLSYEWTFGDGNSSADRTPVHAYASNGTYPVTLKVNFKCGNTILFELSNTRSVNFQAAEISENDLETVSYEVTVPTSGQVINSSVQSYADSWVKNFKNADLSGLSDFQNGKSGVWNPLASYFYDGERSYSDQPNLSADGTYDLKGFSYINPGQDIENGWVLGAKNNSYSEEGFADESVDGLGIYSSNLYGYKGANVIASASNARQNEILVTDFEDISSPVIGNWRLFQGSDFKPIQANIRLTTYLAVVDIPMEEISEFNSVSIEAPLDIYGSLPNFSNTSIICKQPHPTDPNRTILVIPIGYLPDVFSRAYTRAVFKVTLNTPETLIFDSNFAHTGKRSMKIVNPTESITQDLLSLQPAKKYSFSSWVSNGQSSNSIISDPNQFIELIFENGAGTVISSTRFHPSSHAVEKWRKVEGDFVVPPGTKRIQTKFSKGANSAMWIDDVRIMPSDAMMKSYVYDPVTLRLSSILDEENFAITYSYDEEGNLRLLKKETDSGIVTITEVEQFLRTN